MSRSRIRAYLATWRGRRPTAVFTAQYFKRDGDAALSVHRRTWLGIDRPWRSLALLPQRVWSTARWRRTSPDAWLLPPEESLRRLTQSAGVPREVQLERLGRLRRDPGIPPVEAHGLGLTLDGHADSWREFVFSNERDWNIAASTVVFGGSRAAQEAIGLLADKWETSALLERLGIPVVPTILATNAAELSDGVRVAVAKWGEAFIKPRIGSAGRGAAYAGQHDGRLQLSRYPQLEGQLPPTFADLSVRLPLLIQPRLTTPGWEGLDVITIRVVTRDRGHGPEIFSEVLEVPVSPYYDHHLIIDGRIGGLVRPAWMQHRGLDAPEPRVNALGPVPAWINEAAITAHENLRGLFAVAWDVALTNEGPKFLEGNTGFDPLTPQQAAAAGLLTGLADR